MKTLMKTVMPILFLGAMSLAQAQEQGHLSVTTVVQKEQVTVNDDGETVTMLVPAASVVPGDSVVYTITFRNISDTPTADIVITNPVPQHLTYVDGSAFGAGMTIEFSVDGGKTFGKADKLTVAEDGAVRAARAEDYTHLRWVMQNELAPGSQGIASFRAVLN